MTRRPPREALERVRFQRVLLLGATLIVLVGAAVAMGILLEGLRFSLRERELVRHARDEGRRLAALLVKTDGSADLGAGSAAMARFTEQVSAALRDEEAFAYVVLVDAGGKVFWRSNYPTQHRRWRGGEPGSFLAETDQRTRVPSEAEGGTDVFLEMVTAVGRVPPRPAVVLGLSEAGIAAELRRGFWRTVAVLGAGGLALVAVLGSAYYAVSRRRVDLIRKRAREEHLAELGLLAGGLAHELRNPLNAIRFALDSLGRRAASVDEAEVRREMVEITNEVSREVSDLERIVSSFLSYARATGEGDLEDAEVGDVCRSALSTVSAAAQEKGVEPVLELASETIRARLRPGVLRQVLVNLLLNATQACERGGRVVLRASADAQWILLAVEDDGAGVPPGVRKQLFEPFATGRAEGTGLGLAICRRLVSGMDGTITYQPREPRGSVFTVRIPRR